MKINEWRSLSILHCTFMKISEENSKNALRRILKGNEGILGN
jgi:hypothetical protein